MAIMLGSSSASLYLGSVALPSVYLGSESVIEDEPAPGLPDFFLQWDSDGYDGPALTGPMPTIDGGALHFTAGYVHTGDLGYGTDQYVILAINKKTEFETPGDLNLVALVVGNDLWTGRNTIHLSGFFNQPQGYIQAKSETDGEFFGGPYTTDTWLILEGVWYEGGCEFYIDGVLVGSGDHQGTALNRVYIGHDSEVVGRDYHIAAIGVCDHIPTEQKRQAARDWAQERIEPEPGPIEIPDLIAIAHQPNLGVAPHAVAFEPDLDELGLFGIGPPGSTYDERLHSLAYVWSFGDSYPYSAPVNGTFKTAGSGIGPRGAHVYRSPGTYTVRLDVYGFVDGDLVHAFSERTVTVADPEALFAGDRTVFVSTSSDWSLCPDGAIQMTSINDAVDRVDYEVRNLQPMRIMLNRGEEYAFGGARFGFNTEWGKSIHMVAGPGAGARPVINSTGPLSVGSNVSPDFETRDFVFQNLDLRGGYDSTVGDNPDSFPDGIRVIDTSPHSVLTDGCRVDGFNIGVYLMEIGGVPGNGHRGIWFNDTSIQNYGRSGIFGGTYQHFSATGCRVMSLPNAIVNNGTNGGFTLRLGGTAHATMLDSCDIYCSQGWSPNGPIVATQPCARLDDGYVGQLIQVTRCAMEGGYIVLSIRPTDRDALTCNVIVDSNYLLGSYQTSELIGLSYGGTTIRNNIMVMPDAALIAGVNRANQFLGLHNNGGGADNLNAPILYHGNTLIDLIGGMAATSGSGFGSVTTINNAARPADDPFVDEPVLWLPRETGYRSLTETHAGTETPADSVWPAGLGVGSPAIGDAVGLVPILDYSGNVRGSQGDRGAYSA